MEFRLLRADEIDVRVGSVKLDSKTKAFKGVSLLLYKDARCDMNILDETVGSMNWMRSHSRENANCTISLWDDKKQMWISKEDTGTESNTEKEKGLASDSFKRACFCWGIGRELYTAPFIFIAGSDESLKYERFKVFSIKYTNRCISDLIIKDKSGKVVFTWHDNNVDAVEIEAPADDALEPLPAGQKITKREQTVTVSVGSTTDESVEKGNVYKIIRQKLALNKDDMEMMRKALITKGVILDKTFAEMTLSDMKRFGDQAEKEMAHATGKA